MNCQMTDDDPIIRVVELFTFEEGFTFEEDQPDNRGGER